MKKRKVIIIGFGGTIVMVPDKKGVLKPAKNVEEIFAIVPSLKKMADVTFHVLENRDSTNINPGHWSKLAWCVGGVHDKVDGIIITHGTDTMAYTASALSLALGRGLKVPIVFTGSQLPLIAHGTDAKFNLENSMKTLLTACDEGIAEVMIVFGDRVLRANRSIKTSQAKFLAFDSPAFPRLAKIDAVGIHFIESALKINKKSILNIKADFQKGILSIDVILGLEPRILLGILRSRKCKGLLLKSPGAGNVPNEGEYSLLPVIREAVDKLKIPVLISTKFIDTNMHLDIHPLSKMALDAGAISTGDLTNVMAQVKFMWALAQDPKSLHDLKKIIYTDFVGEITP
jgi:L-asparaginase